jgi:hypothetical protein
MPSTTWTCGCSGGCPSRRCRTSPGCDATGVSTRSGPSSPTCDGRRGRRQPGRVAARRHHRSRQRQPAGAPASGSGASSPGVATPRSPRHRRATCCLARRAGPGGVRGVPAGVADRQPDAAPGAGPARSHGPRRRPWRRHVVRGAGHRPLRGRGRGDQPPARPRPSSPRQRCGGGDRLGRRTLATQPTSSSSVGAATWDRSVRALKAGGLVGRLRRHIGIWRHGQPAPTARSSPS